MLSLQSEGQQPHPHSPSSPFLLVKNKSHAHLYTASYTADFFANDSQLGSFSEK